MISHLEPQAITLSQYILKLSGCVEALSEQWVVATVSELKRAAQGHVYFTLVQNNASGDLLAKLRANVWRNTAVLLEAKFQQATGQVLQNNQEVMVCVKPQLHTLFGFSLVVRDIYPEFTLGLLQVKLHKIRHALKFQGLYERNRQQKVPDDFFRVAVLSPADAAGLGDFRVRADQLQKKGILQFEYFVAVFQGNAAADSLCKALHEIFNLHYKTGFDVLVIIRGGGSQSDLASLNDFDVAKLICLSPMPVFCGIGHERDQTILDEVVCQRFSTPSMVIDFIEQRVIQRLLKMQKNFLDVISCTRQSVQCAGLLLDNQWTHVVGYAQRIVGFAMRSSQEAFAQVVSYGSRSLDSAYRRLLLLFEQGIVQNVRLRQIYLKLALDKQRETVNSLSYARLVLAENKVIQLYTYIEANHPESILQRGFVLVFDNQGQLLKKAADVGPLKNARLRFSDASLAITFNNGVDHDSKQ